MPEYRGGELDADRGPGLGCFWFQVIVLAVFLVLVPIGYNLNWPFEVLAVLLFIILGLLLFVGQTLIFLLRLVAADRRTTGRRRPLASTSRTVGQIEDERRTAEARGGAAGGEGSAVSQHPLATADGEATPDGASSGSSSGSSSGDSDADSGATSGAESSPADDAQPGPGGMRE